MGSVYYQQDNDLDSLSNVRGFSSALNGKTYGFKKEGGIFSPLEIDSGSGGVVGVIPDGGLYLDGVNRVGVLLTSDSGLDTDANGLFVKIDPIGGLENNVDGVAIKETDSIDPNGPNVKVDGNTIQIDTTGIEVIPGNNITVTSGVGVNKGAGFTTSNTTLDIGAGDGILVNTNNISARIDNSTITAPGGVLQANFGIIPSFSSYLSYTLPGNQIYDSITPINISFGNPLAIPIPNNFGAIVHIRFSCETDSGNVGITAPRFIDLGYSGSGLTIQNTSQNVNCINGVFDYDANPIPFHVWTIQNASNMIQNTSGATVNLNMSIANSAPIGGTSVCTLREGTVQVYLFPISP